MASSRPKTSDWLLGIGLLAAAVALFWIYAMGQWQHTFYFTDHW